MIALLGSGSVILSGAVELLLGIAALAGASRVATRGGEVLGLSDRDTITVLYAMHV